MDLLDGIYERLRKGEASLSVVGLGYVGMPLAVEFARHFRVIGFNHNERRILQYRSGIDPTMEVGNEVIRQTSVDFTSDEKRLREACFHVVAVPTPINTDHTPDLYPVKNASAIVGRNLSPGSIVVYESTVYPGVTEDVCVPILEAESGLKCGRDFWVGYSPERVNPGDRIHNPVSSIKTAEAVKVVENSQRDINIAFMNELAMVFDRMGIDTNEVIDGMNTKWNALGFRPGLVGGHCIGVDPYYFTYEAEMLGYHSQIILNGRMVNDGMSTFIANTAIRKMVEAGLAPKKSKTVILGLTFKENCPDVRNSKVNDIIRELGSFGIRPTVADPWADPETAMEEYGIELNPIDTIRDADCVIAAVSHREFIDLGIEGLLKLYGEKQIKILIDVKGMYQIAELKRTDINWWRL